MGELGKVQVGAEELGTATLELVEELVGDELPKTVSTTRPGGNGSSSSSCTVSITELSSSSFLLASEASITSCCFFIASATFPPLAS